MIVIIGQDHDDVLYFENILRNKKDLKPLFNKYPQSTGLIFNQEVLLIHGCVTSYVTGLVASELINIYKPLCVLLFGRCKAVSSDLHNGDIAISKQIIPIDIDQCEYFNVKVGQIPGFEPIFNIQTAFYDLLQKSFESVMTNGFYGCTFLSGNTIYSNKDAMKDFGSNNYFLGHHDNFVLDSDCISPFIVCSFKNVAFISVKVIDSKVGEKSDVNNLVKTLEAYSKVGKCITSFIGEIGRRDLVS